MCRWLAYWGTPVYLDSLIFEPEHSLIQQSLRARKTDVITNGDGFGVGWYGERRTPGLYRDILPAWNDPNLKSLAHQVRSPLFFAHVRASTGTATSRANCHPFGYGSWLFMHNGQIGGYQRVRRTLESRLDDAHYAARLGTTDSELFFHLLFGFGLERDPLEALRRTVGLVTGEMWRAGVEEPLRLTAALTDGRQLVVIRFATDPQAPSLFWSARGGTLLIVSEPLDGHAEAWNEVPEGHLLVARCPEEPCIREMAL